MNDYFVPLLILMLLLGIGLTLRRRSTPAPGRTVLDAIKDAILVFDDNNQIIYLNRTARAWFGLGEKVERCDIQQLHAQISPPDDFLALLSQEGQAKLKIGARRAKAVSQRAGGETVIVLHDVPLAPAPSGEPSQPERELAVLDEINQAINTNSNLDELLTEILRKLGQLFPYTSAVISLWDPKLEQLVVKSCVGPMAQPYDVVPLDKGCVARIAREREPLLVNDASQRADLALAPSVRSYVGVPLLVGINFIGTLELTSDQADAFPAQTLATLQVVAGQATVAVENARLHGEALVRADEMATLSTLSAAINASLNLDELLEIIVYSAREAIGCDRSAIFVMDNDRGVLNLAKARGLSEEYIRHSQNLRPRLGTQAQVVLDRYPLVVSDIRRAKTLGQLEPWVKTEGFVSFADLPLRGREHVLGALTVYYDQPHAFGENELELLKTFANQVTLALENARLHERTDRALARRVDQLAAVEEIGRELTSTLDLTRVFNLVLERAMGSTGASAGVLALCQSDHCGKLELIADRGYPSATLQSFREGGWPTDQNIFGRVVRTGETALVNDVHADPDYVTRLEATRAQLTVPIIKEARVLGVVSLESSRSQGFSPDDARFTTQLAELAAIAIDNARLFQQVREGRDNLQAILDSTHGGILVIDREGRIVLANPMIEELSGLSAEELVGRRVGQVITELGQRATALLGYPDDQREDTLRMLESMSDTVSKRTYEVPGTAPLYIEQVASPVIDKDGVVVGRLVVLRDITEERRVAQMRQDLTNMIIHDLRSPLTAVVGGLQVASDLMDASSDAAMIHHALDMASESCDRLMSLVDSLLDISRLEAGQMPLERQPILLPQLAQSVIQQMRPLAEREGVALQLYAISRVPLVEADHDLISRVLVNLIDNALKHSPNNGIVTVKTAPVALKKDPNHSSIDEVLARPRLAEAHNVQPKGALELSQASSGRPTMASPDKPLAQTVRCTVLDMGPGIPPKYRETIFERFAQLGGRRRGTGLGLAFCRLVVQAHGGRIWIEDNPKGQGSAFNFTLPVASSDELAVPDEP